MTKNLASIGQLFIVGFPGENPPSDFLNFLVEDNIGGIILFADNCPTHQHTHDTIALLTSHYKENHPFIAIDQEGGRVCRLRGAPAEFPSAWSFGENHLAESYREIYSRAAVCLESLGINLNLAPVADIYLDENNAVLDSRCFSDQPATVAEFVTTSVQIASQSGLLSCLKHFPGLGAAAIDPHEAVAEASYDNLIWEQREKLPFAAGVAAGVDMIMTTHLLLPKLDDVIVTGSEKIITELLRNELSFDGTVITDDLNMKGAAALGDIGERTVAAFNAGHDLLLFGQDYEASMQAFDYFRAAVERGEVSDERIASALSRVSGLKFKLSSSVMR